MSVLSVEQREDLAERMLPVAAHLAVLVHGDGGPQDVAEALAGLSEAEKNALVVVLAGLVDPEQPVGKALGWLAPDTDSARASEGRPIRELAPEPDEALGEDYVDPVAVDRFVRGFRVEVSDSEFLAAVQQCTASGMSLADVNRLRCWRAGTAENWVNRLRKRYQRAGRPFPSLAPWLRTFTEDEVVRIRERSQAGASDLEIGMSYGVGRETIRAICVGQRHPQFGGPIRGVRSSRGLAASREYMCGHAENSQAAFRKLEMGVAV